MLHKPQCFFGLTCHFPLFSLRFCKLHLMANNKIVFGPEMFLGVLTNAYLSS